MSSKLRHRQAASLPQGVARRIENRPRHAGVHQDQDRRRGGRNARGGRNGERIALRNEAY